MTDQEFDRWADAEMKRLQRSTTRLITAACALNAVAVLLIGLSLCVN